MIENSTWLLYVINVILAFIAFLSLRYLNAARKFLERLASLLLRISKALEDARIESKEIEEIIDEIRKLLEGE